MLSEENKKFIKYSFIFIFLLFVTINGALANVTDNSNLVKDVTSISKIDDTYSYIDYTIPTLEDYNFEDANESTCYDDGYTLRCVYIWNEGDEKVTLNGYKWELAEMATGSKSSYQGKLSSSESIIYESYGIPMIDFRFVGNDTNSEKYKTEYLDSTRLQTGFQDFYTEGFMKIGYHSSIFYYSIVDYGGGQNVSIDTTIEMSNNEYNCSSDSDIIACYHFKDDATDSSIYGNDASLSGVSGLPKHNHEHYNFSNNNVIKIPDISNFLPSNQTAFTFMTWAKVSGTPSEYPLGSNDADNSNLLTIGYSYASGKGLLMRITNSSRNNSFNIFVRRSNATTFNAYYELEENGIDSSEWHQYIVRWDNITENLTMFIDGVPVKSVIDDMAIAGWASGGNWIGGESTNYRTFNGSIDEVILWNTNISDSAIESIYNSGLYVNGINNDSYYESSFIDFSEKVNFTSYDSVHTNNSNSNLTFQFRSGDLARTNTSDSSLIFFMNFTSSIPSYNETGRVAGFSFIDGAVEEDNTIYNNSLNIESDVDIYHSAIRTKDNSDSYAKVNSPDSVLANITRDNLTVSVWVKPKKNSIPSTIISQGDGAGTGRQFFEYDINYCGGVNTFGSRLWGSLLCAEGTNYLVNNWYNLVITYNGTSLAIYVNGEFSNSSVKAIDEGATGDIYIGTSKTIGNGFNGIIDEINFWNVSYTDEQVKELYEQGINHITETVRNKQINSTLSPSEGYFYGEDAIHLGFNVSGYSDNHDVIVFDYDTLKGDEMYYRSLLNFTTQNFTITTLVKPVDSNINQNPARPFVSSPNMEIFSFGRNVNSSFSSSGGYRQHLTARVDGSGEYKLYFSYFNDTLDFARQTVCNTPTIKPDVWTALTTTAGYINSTNQYQITNYINGVQCNQELENGAISPAWGETTSIMPCIGALGFKCNSSVKYSEFVGEIDDVAIYNRVLSPDELVSLGEYVNNLNDVSNNRFMNYKVYFKNTNLLYTPYLTNVTFNFSYPAKLLSGQTIGTLEIELNGTKVIDISSNFNKSSGTNYCNVTGSGFTASDNLRNCNLTFVTTASSATLSPSTYIIDNGYGEFNLSEDVNIVNSKTNYTTSVTPSTRTSYSPFTLSSNFTSSHLVSSVVFGVSNPGGVITNITGTNSSGIWSGEVNDSTEGVFSLEYLYVDTNVTNYTFRPSLTFTRSISSGGAGGDGGGEAINVSDELGVSISPLSLFGVSDNVTLEELDEGIERSYSELFWRLWEKDFVRYISFDAQPTNCSIVNFTCEIQDKAIKFYGLLETDNIFLSNEEFILNVEFNSTTYEIPIIINKINLGVAISTTSLPFELEQDSYWGYLFAIDSNNEIKGIKLAVPILLSLIILSIPIIKSMKNKSRIERRKKVRRKVMEMRMNGR